MDPIGNIQLYNSSANQRKYKKAENQKHIDSFFFSYAVRLLEFD